jgi:hypothetical protein
MVLMMAYNERKAKPKGMSPLHDLSGPTVPAMRGTLRSPRAGATTNPNGKERSN